MLQFHSTMTNIYFWEEKTLPKQWLSSAIYKRQCNIVKSYTNPLTLHFVFFLYVLLVINLKRTSIALTFLEVIGDNKYMLRRQRLWGYSWYASIRRFMFFISGSLNLIYWLMTYSQSRFWTFRWLVCDRRTS